jgi:exopolysaccharide production protein ExoY
MGHNHSLIRESRPWHNGHGSLLWELDLHAKRCMDILGATLGLLLLAPMFLPLILLIRRDGGPALFAQRRIGQHGRSFDCLKFRTMAADAEARLSRMLAENADLAAEWRTTRKLKNDPRVTNLGHVLRRTSLDEIPQLLNVLRGDMSLIGPRPVLQEELTALYGHDAEHYLAMRPGLSGLWQVSGRSASSYGDRVRLDVVYAKTRNTWLDLKILLKTPYAVLSQKGAY